MNFTKSKLVMGFVGAAVAIGFALTPVLASADTASDLQSQINSLMATIASLQAQLSATTGGSTSGTTGYTFNTNLTMGSKGIDVMNLQKVLNMSADTIVNNTAGGAGSPGNETSNFGGLTRAAVVKFQIKNGISPAAGYVGPITRAKLNSMSGTGPATGTGNNGNNGNGGTVTPVVGGALVFAAATQPANSLAPEGAARVPFTTFTLTNTGTNVVTVNGITVQRTGLGQDAVFSGVVLVDNNNIQVGTSKTWNSNHQATIGDTFTINPGETKTLTVAGNMLTGSTALDAYAGQVVTISVVGVNTTATVSGSFPLSGASQTINASLTIGSVSTSTSSFDPGTAQTKNIGDTGVRVSGIKFTANSTEDLKLYSIRWRQVGTASASDFSNVVTIVSGTSYPTTVSSDGKYYTTVFPGGLLIPKGNSIDVYNQVDITGSNSNLRTIDFDVDKVTDVYFVGQLYGYGIAPSGTYTPWYNSVVTTINAGTVTTITKANEVASQNVAVGVNGQVLGGFATNFAGEPTSITQMVVNFNYSSQDATDLLLTSVSLVDSNGAVVAGPVDATDVGGTAQKVTFSDSITFPIGRHVYTLKGKISSSVSNSQTITASTTPSGWSSPTGATTGATVTISTGTITMNTVTVKGAALAINISAQPAAQNIVGGLTDLLLANYQLDASQSGEDVRISSFPVIIDFTGTATVADLSGCTLSDGATILNTGSRTVNTLTDATKVTFTFDNSLTIPKGTVKTLALKCNLTSSPVSTAYFVTRDATAADYSVTGVTSNTSVTPTWGSGNGGLMTVATGSFTASHYSSTGQVVAGGTTGVTIGTFKFRASNENINLTKVGLVLSTSTATDIGTVYLYNGATQVGTVNFPQGAGAVSTSTLTTPLLLTAGTDVLLTIKADLADIGTGLSGTEGVLVKIDVQSAEGSGLSSGATKQVGSVTAAVTGVRVFKSFPTIALDTLPSTGALDGKLMRFKITASPKGSVGIFQLAFTVATSSSTAGGVATAVKLYAYTDPAYTVLETSSLTNGTSTGQFGATSGTAGAITVSAPTLTYRAWSGALQVPAGETRYLELKGTVTNPGTSISITTTLLGDSSYITTFAESSFVATIAGAITDSANFIWSGNATTTAAVSAAGVTSDNDWANGFNIPGLPSGGISQTRQQ